ncbi:MAG: hypothetical protein AUJ04_08700 [Acidobacteria bacterium 13_1_40CM_3_55_6]|nr:MAG: hypothetical protein AUJ04_08700 [Acidobacteria bacterium 13_1_40CM_3_55_6]
MRFKLFALRDELREGIIDGAMPENKWFEYLDTSITKMIDLLPTITVWEALALVLRYRNDPEVQQAQVTLFTAFGEEENQKLAGIYGKFVGHIIELLFRRHVGIRYGMTGIARTVVNARALKKKTAEIITVAPETSTLTHYA